MAAQSASVRDMFPGQMERVLRHRPIDLPRTALVAQQFIANEYAIGGRSTEMGSGRQADVYSAGTMEF